MSKYVLDISGMNCAACSSRVEKAALSVDGVTSASVNLLKNSMNLICEDQQKTLNSQSSRALQSSQDSPATLQAVIQAIEKAGYGAQLRTTRKVDDSKSQFNASNEDILRQRSKPSETLKTQAKTLRLCLIVSCVFSIPLLYLSMGLMFSWPLPSFFHQEDRALAIALIQLILLLPVVLINRRFFTSGFKSLFRAAPTMDTLIALGAGASIIYGLWSLLSISLASQASSQTAAYAVCMNLHFESAAMILTLVTLGKWLEAQAKGRTTNAIETLMDLAPRTALRLLEDGTHEEVPVDTLVPGDTLLVKAGSVVPADGKVLEGTGTVNESAFTGEAFPLDKTVGSSLIGATICCSGYLVMEVEHIGAESALAKVIAAVDEASSTKAPIQRFADKVSAIFVPAVMGIAALVLIIWLIISGGDWECSLNFAICVLVISCPCALGLATPTAIMVGMGRGAHWGILIKSAEVLENAHDINTVVLDKTGTITQGHPTVTDVLVAKNVSRQELLSIAYAIEYHSEHPLAKAICSYCEQERVSRLAIQDFQQLEGGLKARLAGQELLVGNRSLLEQAGITVEVPFAFGEAGTSGTSGEADTPSTSGASDEDLLEASLAMHANQLLNAGKTTLFLSYANQCVGLIALADTIKLGSKEAIAQLRDQGIKTCMLTGDEEAVAASVAKQVGVDDFKANLMPTDKLSHIAQLKKEGKVAMVGDGINDAPALAGSDIGIALGAGTDVAIESADIVLMHDDLRDVVAGIQLSQATLKRIRWGLFWALIYNVICIPLAGGLLAPLGFILNPTISAACMSISSVTVVLNALVLQRWKPLKKSQHKV